MTFGKKEAVVAETKNQKNHSFVKLTFFIWMYIITGQVEKTNSPAFPFQ